MMLANVAACKLDEAMVPQGKPRIVVHAVLNPVTLDEVVLVERTLAGEVTVPDRTGGDSLEPILSGGGVPLTDAVVTIREAGDASFATGIEDAAARPDGKGHGVYRFRNTPPPQFSPRTNQVPIVRGRRYELEITWNGQVAHAFTTVPNPDRLQPISFTRTTFNVDHDSIVLDWPKAQAAKRYALLATTPFGPFMLFSDSARLVVRGGLRNLFAEGLPFVFVPGFRQTIATEAVDTNYFDYFRSFNNPFTGSGIVNHVDGGIGVFGAIYPLDTLGLDVTADFDESFEGHYVGGPGGSDALDLYLGESVGNGARRVTGRLSRGVTPNGIVGFTTGDGKLSLAVLQGQFANDTLALFPAVAAGDSIVGAIGSEAPSVYRRTSPAPLTAARATRLTADSYPRPQRSASPRPP
ncbi:MAG TPA: hypothetical protein VNS52_20430 [Gemmatimonadaceae bacterium]|nr:hypothetical protein [Gemmatimonadaceae bacterium]